MFEYECGFPDCPMCKMLSETEAALKAAQMTEILEADYNWDETWFFIDNLPMTKD